MARISIVADLLFGDCGKGSTTAFLTALQNPKDTIVIRTTGGSQAGHTVIHDGKRHVFSHFGSGTLQGAPTYWSTYCPVNPLALMTEYFKLRQLDVNPVIYVDPLSPLTTPYDVAFNRFQEKERSDGTQHGSCGVGFGCTIERQTTTPYKIYAQDMMHPAVMKQKLKAIEFYYRNRTFYKYDKEMYSLPTEEEINTYNEAAADCLGVIKFAPENEFLNKNSFSHYIFEGSQGILLDMDFGLFPNVTRCNTTSKNAIEFIKRNNLINHDKFQSPVIYYVTRAYQTRHGNGFMTNEDLKPELIINRQETNTFNQWQGHLRKGLMDIDLINYALDCDNNFTHDCPKNIVVTCLDQIKGEWKATHKGEVFSIFEDKDFLAKLDKKFVSFLKSYSPDYKTMDE